MSYHYLQQLRTQTGHRPKLTLRPYETPGAETDVQMKQSHLAVTSSYYFELCSQSALSVADAILATLDRSSSFTAIAKRCLLRHFCTVHPQRAVPPLRHSCRFTSRKKRPVPSS